MVIQKKCFSVNWLLLFCGVAFLNSNAVVAFNIARDNKGCNHLRQRPEYSSKHHITGETTTRIFAKINNNGPPSSSSNQHYPDDECIINGSSGSNNQCKDKKKKTPLKLNWNLPALLSCQEDPKDVAQLIPLETVYNAVTTAIQNNAVGQKQQHISGERSAFEEETSIESIQYNGKLTPNLAPYRRFVRKYNYDMGHDGRFSVLGSSEETDDSIQNDNGASIQPSVVFLMDDPLSYIRDALTYQEKRQRSRRKNVNGNCIDDEVVIFAPGLHTFHERTAMENNEGGPNCGKRTSTERVKYYSQVLDGLPMAQIHAGTYLDQIGGVIDIKLSWKTVEALRSFGLLQVGKDDDREYRPKTTGRKVRCSIGANDIDILRAILCNARDASLHLPKRGNDDVDDDNEQLKRTMMKLIDLAVQSVLMPQKQGEQQSPNLVLMTYSATSNILTAALSEWKHLATNSMITPVNPNRSNAYDAAQRQILSKPQAELLLHRAVTIITINNLSKKFVDGPAYIHLSMHDDILSSSLGVSKDRPEGGGKDAVYIHGFSPYTRPPMTDDDDGIYAYDSHSMDSCAVQYLSLVRRINGITSFRQLYNLAKKETVFDINPSLYQMNYRTVGQLEMPPDIDDELLPSMIRATGGERWLWNPKLQLGEGGADGFDSPLPSMSNADATLTNQLGYNIYDEIVEACCVGCIDMEQ